MRISVSAILFGLCSSLLLSCGTTSTQPVHADFTRADSLTDYYLSLQDSVHRVWNMMINDDNQKVNAMHSLVHELIVSHPEEMEVLTAMEGRLEQLMRMRYTQKSMVNFDVVVEYDVASSSLLNDVLETARAKKEFSYNKTLQQLVDDMLQADVRVRYHRSQYDSIVYTYNKFIDENREFLQQTDEGLSVEKKPLFRMVAED